MVIICGNVDRGDNTLEKMVVEVERVRRRYQCGLECFYLKRADYLM